MITESRFFTQSASNPAPATIALLGMGRHGVAPHRRHGVAPHRRHGVAPHRRHG